MDMLGSWPVQIVLGLLLVGLIVWWVKFRPQY
jgi:hypothetical protein